MVNKLAAKYKDKIKALLNELNFISNSKQLTPSATQNNNNHYIDLNEVNKAIIIENLKTVGISSDKLQLLIEDENFNFETLKKGIYDNHQVIQDFKLLCLMLDPKFIKVINNYSYTLKGSNGFKNSYITQLEKWEIKLNELLQEKNNKASKLSALKQMSDAVTNNNKILPIAIDQFSHLLKEGEAYFNKMEAIKLSLTNQIKDSQSKGWKVVERIADLNTKEAKSVVVQINEWKDKLADFLNTIKFQIDIVNEINELKTSFQNNHQSSLDIKHLYENFNKDIELKINRLEIVIYKTIDIINTFDSSKQEQMLKELSSYLATAKDETTEQDYQTTIMTFKSSVESKLQAALNSFGKKAYKNDQVIELITEDIQLKEKELNEHDKTLYKAFREHFNINNIDNKSNPLYHVKKYIFEAKVEKENTITPKLLNQKFISDLINKEESIKGEIIHEIKTLKHKEEIASKEKELKLKETTIQELENWNKKLLKNNLYEKLEKIISSKAEFSSNPNVLDIEKHFNAINKIYSQQDFFLWQERIQDSLFSKEGKFYEFFNTALSPLNYFYDKVRVGGDLLVGIATLKVINEGWWPFNNMPWSKELSGTIDSVLMKEWNVIKQNTFDKLRILLVKEKFLNSKDRTSLGLELNNKTLETSIKPFNFTPIKLGEKSLKAINELSISKYENQINQLAFANKITNSASKVTTLFEEGSPKQVINLKEKVATLESNIKEDTLDIVKEHNSKLVDNIIHTQLAKINKAINKDIQNELKHFEKFLIEQVGFFTKPSNISDDEALSLIKKIMQEVYNKLEESLKGFPKNLATTIDEKMARYITQANKDLSPHLENFINKHYKDLIEKYSEQIENINNNLIAEAHKYFGIKLDEEENEYLSKGTLSYQIKDQLGLKHIYEILKETGTFSEDTYQTLLQKNITLNSNDLEKKLGDITFLDSLNTSIFNDHEKSYIDALRLKKHSESVKEIYQQLETLEGINNKASYNSFNLKNTTSLKELLDSSDWYNLKQPSASLIDSIQNIYKSWFSTDEKENDTINYYTSAFHNIIEIAKAKMFLNLVDAKKQAAFCSIDPKNNPVDCTKDYKMALVQFSNLFPYYDKDSSLIKNKIFELSLSETNFFYDYQIPLPKLEDKEVWEQVYEEYIELADHIINH